LKNYVGCKLVENSKNREMWIVQPKLIDNMEENFKEQLAGREAKVPAAPKFMVTRPKEDEEVIDPIKQSEYRSGVGMLLYLIKHSRPEIANAVRELTKVLDRATPEHYKAMLRAMKYVLETRDYGLHMKPVLNGNLFKLVGKADSEFCGDKETRISVYGFILYFCGCAISWRSKMGRSVTLSSTEAEYVSISELAKEVLFVKHVLDSMGLLLEYPIIIEVDNAGAIYLANNHTTSQRTKHVDTRYHFVRNYIEDGIIKVVFVRSEDNDADIFTKNTSIDLFLKHRDKFLSPVDIGD
jgi:hypothetical protein